MRLNVCAGNLHRPPRRHGFAREAGLRAYELEREFRTGRLPALAAAQWLNGPLELDYRCGGSVGIGLLRTDFP